MVFAHHRPLIKWPLRLLLIWLALPYVLTVVYFIVPPPSTLMVAGWLTGEKVQRRWVPLSQMPSVLVDAVLTSEDDAFCLHYGVDFRQLKKSVKRASDRDRPVMATSTISQQLAKNLFFWHGRSWLRKILETPVALWIELLWSKEHILEAYLNVAQWGKGVYGAEAAARAHFGVPVRAISSHQAALLATSLPNPIARNASKPGPAQSALAATLLSRMGKDRPDKSCLR